MHCVKTLDFGLVCYAATIMKIIQCDLSFPWKKELLRSEFFFHFCKEPADTNVLLALVQYTVSTAVLNAKMEMTFIIIGNL